MTRPAQACEGGRMWTIWVFRLPMTLAHLLGHSSLSHAAAINPLSPIQSQHLQNLATSLAFQWKAILPILHEGST
jgi:hypothetical protein